MQATREPKQLCRPYIVHYERWVCYEVKWRRGQLRTDAHVKVYALSYSLPIKLLFSIRAAHSQPENSTCIPEPDYEYQYETQLDNTIMPPRANKDAQESMENKENKDYETFLATRKMVDSEFCKYYALLC